jgi:hypothetical protein
MYTTNQCFTTYGITIPANFDWVSELKVFHGVKPIILAKRGDVVEVTQTSSSEENICELVQAFCSMRNLTFSVSTGPKKFYALIIAEPYPVHKIANLAGHILEKTGDPWCAIKKQGREFYFLTSKSRDMFEGEYSYETKKLHFQYPLETMNRKVECVKKQFLFLLGYLFDPESTTAREFPKETIMQILSFKQYRPSFVSKVLQPQPIPSSSGLLL